MRLKLALLLSALLIFPFSANAQEKSVNDLFLPDIDTGWLRFLGEKTISVVVDDQVTGGCWTSAEATKTAVKLQFIRSGYTVVDETNTFNPVLRIRGYGYKGAENYCVTVASIDLLAFDYGIYAYGNYIVNPSITSAFLREIMSSDYLISGRQSNQSQRMKEKFVEMSQKMLVTITDKKQEVKGRIAALVDGEAKKYWTDHFIGF